MDPTGGRQAAPASSSSQLFTWQPPDGSLSIQIDLDVVDRILPDVMRGFGALPKRGAEVGGILLGQFEPDSPNGVLIEDLEPVPCEYASGPSYHLSPRDLQRLEETLQQVESRNQTVVGWYRSHTRKDLFLDADDLELAKRYFSHPSQVILLVKPYATRTSIGGFFFSEDGVIHAESSYLEFPFHRRELSGGEAYLPARPPQELPGVRYFTPGNEATPPLPPPPPTAFSSPPAPVVQEREYFYRPSASWDDTPAEEPLEEPAESLRPLLRQTPEPSFDVPELDEESSPESRWRAVLIPVLAAVIPIGSYILYQQLTLPKPPAPVAAVNSFVSPLNLAISDLGEKLEVNWDRQTPAIASALRGTLSIQDGANHRVIELTQGQLQDARVLYSRLTEEVHFRLEVFTSERSSLTELADFRPAAATPAPAAAAPEAPPVSSAQENPPPSPPAAVPAEQPPARRTERTFHSARKSKSTTQKETLRPVEPVSAPAARQSVSEKPAGRAPDATPPFTLQREVPRPPRRR